jgi:8-oxo-dGTP diphosphatase
MVIVNFCTLMEPMRCIMKVNFHELGSIEENQIKFVVIPSQYQGKWIFVKHKERDTWEMPGGHIEAGETIAEAAKRELYEESGAIDFDIEALCDYSVTREEGTTFGRLFLSGVRELGSLPELEIGEVRLFDGLPEALTYPFIIRELFGWINK